MEDMAGLAGLWYQKLWAHVPKKMQNATYRVPGGAFVSLDSGYDVDRWEKGECSVEVAQEGANYTLVIEDFINNKVAKRTIEVQLPSGDIVPVTYKTGSVRAYRGQL
jgi:hypothetical protein